MLITLFVPCNFAVAPAQLNFPHTPGSRRNRTCSALSSSRPFPALVSRLPLWLVLRQSQLPSLRFTVCIDTGISHYRTLVVRLLSTAQTGFMYTIKRKRLIGYYKFVKYDPIGALVTITRSGSKG